MSFVNDKNLASDNSECIFNSIFHTFHTCLRKNSISENICMFTANELINLFLVSQFLLFILYINIQNTIIKVHKT